MGNDTRRLTLTGTNYVFLNEGAYGSVFVDRDAGRIRKILRRTTSPEAHCRAVLQAEKDALKMAQGHDTLVRYVAAPILELPLAGVMDRDGRDVTAEFYEDAGFEAAYVEGTFYKIGDVAASNWHQLSHAFRAAGIRHLLDSSVTLDSDGNVTKVIDFATHQMELEW